MPRPRSDTARSALLLLDPAELAAGYDRRPFLVRHRACDEPLLAREQLFELALRMPREDVIHRLGRVRTDESFDEAHLRNPTGLTLEQTLARFDELGASLTLNFPEKDPHYRPLVEGVIDGLREALRPLGEQVTWFATYFFVSTPGSRTPYHMDRELNFLLQVRGRKKVRLWDPWDERVLSHEQVERLFALWGREPRPQWSAALDALSTDSVLEPGAGIHHPFIAPHVVETLDEPSISWAVTFRTRTSDRTTALAKVNHRLRQLGLRPGRPGEARLADALKLAALAAAKPAMALARALRRRG